MQFGLKCEVEQMFDIIHSMKNIKMTLKTKKQLNEKNNSEKSIDKDEHLY